MPKIKVIYNREGCIGAAACVAIAPKFWKLADDGKADLLGASFDPKTNRFVLEIEVREEDFILLRDSAQACPVQVIEVIEEK